MKTCIATVSLGGTLEDKLDGIAAAGFDGVEILDADLTAASSSTAEIRRRCDDLGLTVDLYQPFRRAEGVTETEFADVLLRFHRESDIMEALGGDAILVVSNTDDDAIDDRDLSASQLHALGEAAAEHGATVMFEALAWGTHINRIADVEDALRRADHPSLSLVVDTFHLYAAGDGIEQIHALDPRGIGFLQVADAPWMDLELIQWSRNHRCFPGDGEFDVLAPVAGVIEAGYTGPLSLEIFNPGYRERPAADVAAHGAESLDALISRLQYTTT
ncbi:sugar phosphate isomerase/epimerase family protein [Rhodococcoides fascians]|uniref:sugar phosphate isomerase/epimerase family protein n=1 Tax=Rhodococcoides fascians TaxID=1828 RepID=UPI000567B158|nr:MULTISPECIES: sugar phosphate isomerase/epimerase [Rhodococcus]OZF05630.1 sugar phosphate isomerase/epimerase [Rhodococcus sp. 15-1189-1-1a]OZF20412.1 sugar phosphate isomerase/epimerase [Rhodococcus sp. 14-2686-1-2]